VVQRHLDRWLYEHDVILNQCWPQQLNSTDPHLAVQCEYNLSSVWANWPRLPDPYAAPAEGHCTCPQLVRQGRDHAARLGAILQQQFASLYNATCPAGSIRLEFKDEQKNELTAQTEYQALCGRLPSLAEYPATQCVIGTTNAPGTPFFLNLGVCNSTVANSLTTTVNEALLTSSFMTREYLPLAQYLRYLTGHTASTPPVVPKTADTWVDSLVDCVVCHACLGLPDVPSSFERWDDGLFETIDAAQTHYRQFPLLYFSRHLHNQTLAAQFASIYYGYYFRVLLDRMQAVIEGRPDAIPISLQVLSDTNITPLLVMLGIEERLRPGMHFSLSPFFHFFHLIVSIFFFITI
jgi:hypothetical protein